ncbi:MAG: GNAT family N-acetyltransferase [Pseudomonadota bacterium]
MHDLRGSRFANCGASTTVVAENDNPQETTASEGAMSVVPVPLSARSIKTLYHEWADLAGSAIEPNPFIEPGFVQAAISLFPDGGRPQILTVRHASGRLDGLMILGLARSFVRLPLAFAQVFAHRHQFLGVPLVRVGSEQAFAEALFSWLDSSGSSVDFLKMPQQHENGPVCQAMMTLAGRQNRICHIINRFDRPVCEKKGSDEATGGATDTTTYGETILERLSSSRRKSIRRKRARLEARGTTTVEQLADKTQIAAWTEDFLDLELRSWKGVYGTSMAQSPEEMAFFRQMTRELGGQGRLRWWRMKLDDLTIAMSVDVKSGDDAFAFKAAFDAKYRDYSPGSLLDVISTDSFLTQNAINSIDSCVSKEAEFLDRIWGGRKTIAEVVVGKRRILAAAKLRVALIALEIKRRYLRGVV